MLQIHWRVWDTVPRRHTMDSKQDICPVCSESYYCCNVLQCRWAQYTEAISMIPPMTESGPVRLHDLELWSNQSAATGTKAHALVMSIIPLRAQWSTAKRHHWTAPSLPRTQSSGRKQKEFCYLLCVSVSGYLQKFLGEGRFAPVIWAHKMAGSCFCCLGGRLFSNFWDSKLKYPKANWNMMVLCVLANPSQYLVDINVELQVGGVLFWKIFIH